MQKFGDFFFFKTRQSDKKNNNNVFIIHPTTKEITHILQNTLTNTNADSIKELVNSLHLQSNKKEETKEEDYNEFSYFPLNSFNLPKQIDKTLLISSQSNTHMSSPHK